MELLGAGLVLYTEVLGPRLGGGFADCGRARP